VTVRYKGNRRFKRSQRVVVVVRSGRAVARFKVTPGRAVKGALRTPAS
jgi:hypothetical protein